MVTTLPILVLALVYPLWGLTTITKVSAFATPTTTTTTSLLGEISCRIMEQLTTAMTARCLFGVDPRGFTSLPTSYLSRPISTKTDHSI